MNEIEILTVELEELVEIVESQISRINKMSDSIRGAVALFEQLQSMRNLVAAYSIGTPPSMEVVIQAIGDSGEAMDHFRSNIERMQ